MQLHSPYVPDLFCVDDSNNDIYYCDSVSSTLKKITNVVSGILSVTNTLLTFNTTYC